MQIHESDTGAPQIDLAFLSVFDESGKTFLFDGSTLSLGEVSPTLGRGISDAIATGAVKDCATSEFLERNAGPRRPARPSSRPPSISRPIREAYLMLTTSCNLRCRYCFDAADGYAARRMTDQTLHDTLRFLAGQSDSSGLKLVLWGGEPLLYPDLVESALFLSRQFCAERSLPLKVVTTTNGTRIDDKMADLLARYNVGVNVSIDGDACEHDRNRVDCRGRGTHATIVDGVSRLRAAQAAHGSSLLLAARMTVSRESVKNLATAYESLWEDGFPIVWAKDVDWVSDASEMSFDADAFDELAVQYRRLRDRMFDLVEQGDGPKLQYQLRYDLRSVYLRERRTGSCGAGGTTVTVSPEGEILPCYFLDGDVGYRLGTTCGQTPHISRRPETWVQPVDDRGPCRSCVVKYLCGGGCPSKARAHGMNFPECWPGQCTFVKLYQDHRIRLLARLLSRSKHADAVKSVLRAKER